MLAVPPGLPAGQSRETLPRSGPVTSAPTSNSRYSPLAKRCLPDPYRPTDGRKSRSMDGTPAVVLPRGLCRVPTGERFPGTVLPYLTLPEGKLSGRFRYGFFRTVTVRRERAERVIASGAALACRHCPKLTNGRALRSFRGGITVPLLSEANGPELPGRFLPYRHCPKLTGCRFRDDLAVRADLVVA